MKRKDLFNNSDITEPKASNKTGAYGTFYFRDVYDSFIFKDAEKDLWYADHYYGRVNHAKEAVIASEKNLKQLSNDEATVLALPPVALIAFDTPVNTVSASSIVPPAPSTDADNVVNCLVDAAIGTFNFLDVCEITERPFSKVS